MIVVGELALWLALVYSVWGMVASVIGSAAERPALAASGVRALGATSLMTLLALAGVITALARRDYELAFAAAHTSHALPLPYAIAALWTAPAGAALLLAAAVAIAGTVAAGRRTSHAATWMVALLSVAVLACVAPLCFSNALYARLASVPADGAGLAPPLQSPFLLVQAPLAAIGYGALAPHFALGLGALVVRTTDETLQRTARRIGVVGWLALGISILVALAWASRDPEWWSAWPRRVLVDGSLIAWLAAGVSLATSRPRWHGRRSSAIALVVAAAVAIVAIGVAPLGLVPTWSEDARVRAGAALVAVTVALVAVAWRSVGPPSAPRAGAEAIGRSVTERIGFALVVAGMLTAGAAAAALRGRAEHQTTIETGRPVTLRDPRGTRWQLIGQGVSSYQSRNRDVRALAIALSHGDGTEGLLTAERWQALDRAGHVLGEPVAVAGVYSTVAMDVRVLLGESAADVATVRVAFEPFAQLIWIAGVLLLVGGASIAWR